MKKFLAIVIVIAIFIGVFAFFPTTETKYLRIHIRANSNSIEDQNIKYDIKDIVCEYLTPLFIDCDTIEKATKILENNLHNIEMIIDNYLVSKSFTYKSTAKINNEFFPTRSYSELVLDSGYYDALIITLGNGQGDNWWCVIYPPMCFIDNTKNIVYKSKLLSIIRQILK